jgi:hypothetical protein
MAKSLALLGQDNLIKVQITLQDKSEAPAFKKALESSKGQVVTELDNLVYAMVPSDEILKLAARNDVYAIAVPPATVHQ